jgi:hypothetical protein
MISKKMRLSLEDDTLEAHLHNSYYEGAHMWGESLITAYR